MQNMKQMMLPLLVLAVLVISALFFAWQGVSLQGQVSGEEVKFHALQDAYFSLAKADRDTAPTGSELNKQLVQIQNYPSELLRLKLVGVGKILTGIFFVLLSIVFLLFMMPIRLAKLMSEKKMGSINN
ncbi:MAG: hypothetical protein Greene07147_299 [Parcubacteria group bacterium Greene0714_7]|nr:MAG: hypothetical protein Greene07147_299 [Parcubacteria group bacterium Greene0714_7]